MDGIEFLGGIVAHLTQDIAYIVQGLGLLLGAAEEAIQQRMLGDHLLGHVDQVLLLDLLQQRSALLQGVFSYEAVVQQVDHILVVIARFGLALQQHAQQAQQGIRGVVRSG